MGLGIQKSFPAGKIKLKRIYESRDIGTFNGAVITWPKVKEVYGNLSFPKLPEDRTYTYGSLVSSVDGRISFSESSDSTQIAKRNIYDPDGSLCDLWVLNMLRSVSDAVLMGSKTIGQVPGLTGRVLDRELLDERKKSGKPLIPLHVIVTRNGEHLPFQHRIIVSKDIPALIVTSPNGVHKIKGRLAVEYKDLGLYRNLDEISAMKCRRFISTLGIIAVGTGDTININLLLRILKKIGINRLLIESPSFIDSLMQESLLDELFLNTSGVFIGGKAPVVGESFIGFSKDWHPHLQILTIHSHSDYFVYSRYRMHYS
ncbi:MAG: dihydrofolate reductase family protein [Spirochaetales bacterium]|nr:dihydrofolate reductase family protein [Spirochaetales bacterium]